MPALYALLIIAFFGLAVLFGTFITVQQGTVAIITRFGKYARIMRPGLNIKIPFIESVYKRFSVQNRSAELAFRCWMLARAPAAMAGGSDVVKMKPEA